MRKRTKRILDNLYEALAHYKAAYKDKTAQLFDAHGHIKILQANEGELKKYADSLYAGMKSAEAGERLSRGDFEASEDAMSTARTEFMDIRDDLNKRLDAVCERNRWYSDLIHAMTGNRDHETMPPEHFEVRMTVGKDGVSTVPKIVVSAIPGKDCEQKAFCKSFVSESCVEGSQQCAGGICRRVQELDRQNATLAGKCKYCRGELKSDAERIREYCEYCNLPF